MARLLRYLMTMFTLVAVCAGIGASAVAAGADACTGDPKFSDGVRPRFTLSIDPATQWQPENGFYRVTVAGQGVADIRSVRVCMRWLGASDWGLGLELHVEHTDLAAVSYTIRRPGRMEMPSGMTPQFEGQLAQVAQLRVEVRNEKGDVLLDEALRVGVTRSVYGYLAAAAAMVMTIGFAVWVSREIPGGGYLKIIARRDGTASLSQFQILLWSLVIGGSSIHVMVISGNLLHLSSGTLVLLGIAGVASLAANMRAAQDASKLDSKVPINDVPAGNVQVPDAPIAGRATPRWSDLVISGQGRSAEIDITRVQMLFFTMISAVFVLLSVAERQVVPEIPTEYLSMMGISNGVYLSAKFVHRGAAR